MNRRTGEDMHVNLVKCHVYQQLKADELQSKSQYDHASICRYMVGSVCFFETL